LDKEVDQRASGAYKKEGIASRLTLRVNMERLTWKRKAVLEAILKETREAAPPTAKRVEELVGARVELDLRELLALGFLRQTYKGGPYIPAVDAEGRAVRLALVPVEADAS
jgi:hypothetical protein